MPMTLLVWFLIRSPSLPFILPLNQHVWVSQPPPVMVNHRETSDAFLSLGTRTDPACTTYTIVPRISYHSASAVLPCELYFLWDCLMKNNEEISHIPQTGTHHDKTHTRSTLWFKWIVRLCLTRNHLEQAPLLWTHTAGSGTNEHTKI